LNIILFQPEEVEHPLSRNDARARHIIGVLRLQTAGTFDAGLINGPRGKGTLIAIDDNSLTLNFAWGEPSPPLWPIHLLVGLPRPQTARDILRDVTALGVISMHFIPSDRGEASYSNSGLWKTDEWIKCVINGAAQAFCTRLPEVFHKETLTEAINSLPSNCSLVALDNYEAPASLAGFCPTKSQPLALAVGSERGWSPEERVRLRNAGFSLAHLGNRVLRTETACIAAIAIIQSKLGLF
jgi:16S rRNA (uracil1498-N3)-methyltransferase